MPLPPTRAGSPAVDALIRVGPLSPSVDLPPHPANTPGFMLNFAHSAGLDEPLMTCTPHWNTD